jgi:hypothetical protein
MSEPIVFISHLRVKEGAADAYRQLQREVVPKLEVDKPRTLVFLTYLDGDGANMTVVHVFADAEAMGLHFEGAEERAKAAYEVLIPDRWEIYGPASEAAVETIRNAAASSGATLTLQPEYVAGFLRLTPA